MFSIFGLMLVLFGLFTNASDTLYARSLGINVNLWTGLLIGLAEMGLASAWRRAA